MRVHRLLLPLLATLVAATATATAAGAQGGDRLHDELAARYRQLYGALEARDVAAASVVLSPAYAGEWEAGWRRWLAERSSAGPWHVTIERLDRPEPARAVVEASSFVVSATAAGEPGVVHQLRRDTWVRGSGGWLLEKSEPVTQDADGEMIPSAREPESPRIRALLDQFRVGDTLAVETFWREIWGRAPLVEPAGGDTAHRLVTFVWREASDSVRVALYGELPYPPWGDRSLRRLPGTDVWYRTLRVPADSRTTYGIDVVREFEAPGRSGAYVVSIPDPRNPREFNEASVLELSSAPPQPYLAERSGVAKGLLRRDTIASQVLGEARVASIYTPPGFGATGPPYPVVVLFDGAVYGGGARPLVPTPTILDNLIADGRIPPVIAVLVHQKDRERELAGSEAFTRYLAEELMPRVRDRYRGTADPARVVIGGSSLGGLAASFAAIQNPRVFGNVLSQSGAFWLPRDPRDPARAEAIPRSIWFADELVRRPAAPLRFWMEVSRYESAAKMLGPNRQIRDVLRAKGYHVRYREVHGGHDYLHWRGSLADGLIALLGTSARGGPYAPR